MKEIKVELLNAGGTIDCVVLGKTLEIPVEIVETAAVLLFVRNDDPETYNQILHDTASVARWKGNGVRSREDPVRILCESIFEDLDLRDNAFPD